MAMLFRKLLKCADTHFRNNCLNCEQVTNFLGKKNLCLLCGTAIAVKIFSEEEVALNVRLHEIR